MSPRAGLVDYERQGKLERCLAEYDRKKRTLCNGREDGRQGGWSDSYGELLVYCSGLDCMCMYFPLAIVRIFVYYVCSILSHDYER